ncbi:MAG TPA: LLM class flavin-dependent oxidoreductase [Candidatus Binataceae bacterium]|nr:LLM class flavin-dependent oxidoreductase [Candidatus Binataceae bacterium]
MRIALFDTLQWKANSTFDPQAAAAVYAQRLDEWERAEQLGFDGVYIAEHHFNSVLTPSPNVLLGALAQRTRRIRLGVMVNVLSFHDPLRVAVESAMLDLLSGGRLDVGVGRGVSIREYEGHHLAWEEGRARVMEGMELVLQAWTQDVVQFNGQFRQLGPVRVSPKPLQQPHPPVWAAAYSDETIRWAADKNFSVGFTLVPTEAICRQLDLYRQLMERRGRTAGPQRILVTRPVFVGATDAQARADSEGPINDMFRYFSPPGIKGEIRQWPAGTKFYSEFYRAFLKRNLSFEDLIEAGIIVVGGADTVARSIATQLQRTGADNFLAWMNLGAMNADLARASQEAFAAQVMPRLRQSQRAPAR